MPRIVAPMRESQAPAPNRIRWTRAQCQAIQEANIIDGRYELVEGEIISKMGQGPQHAYVITRLIAWLFVLFGADFVRFQLPIQVPGQDNQTSEPEPDAAVLSRPASDFLEATPDASDVLMVVEVADTTLSFDRSTKAALYARAGIPEYWIVDIAGRQVLVHRQPTMEGYIETVEYGSDEMVVLLARPNDPVRVANLLPPVGR